MSVFKREIKWEPGFDYRADPEKKKYGCHGLQIRWLLHGAKGTVQFLIMTDWLPTWKMSGSSQFGPFPADLGYHADTPLYSGQPKSDCDMRPEGHCYYDGSGLRAENVFRLLITEGEDAVWKMLESEYKARFEE